MPDRLGTAHQVVKSCPVGLREDNLLGGKLWFEKGDTAGRALTCHACNLRSPRPCCRYKLTLRGDDDCTYVMFELAIENMLKCEINTGLINERMPLLTFLRRRNCLL